MSSPSRFTFVVVGISLLLGLLGIGMAIAAPLGALPSRMGDEGLLVAFAGGSMAAVHVISLLVTEVQALRAKLEEAQASLPGKQGEITDDISRPSFG